MESNILNNLILLGQLHEHMSGRINNGTVELINRTNKIIVKILTEKTIGVEYNVFGNKKNIEISTAISYDFLEELLARNEPIEIDTKDGELIEITDWKNELQSAIQEIYSQKNYNHYLKNLKIDSLRFEVEYYDNIVVIRDKNKSLLTNVEVLKNAVQHRTVVKVK